MSDEDSFTFRDKAAIEILAALIKQDNNKEAYNTVDTLVNGGYYNSEPDKKYAEERMLVFIRASYKIADLMRKVRLTVFE